MSWRHYEKSLKHVEIALRFLTVTANIHSMNRFQVIILNFWHWLTRCILQQLDKWTILALTGRLSTAMQNTAGILSGTMLVVMPHSKLVVSLKKPGDDRSSTYSFIKIRFSRLYLRWREPVRTVFGFWLFSISFIFEGYRQFNLSLITSLWFLLGCCSSTFPSCDISFCETSSYVPQGTASKSSPFSSLRLRHTWDSSGSSTSPPISTW